MSVDIIVLCAMAMNGLIDGGFQYKPCKVVAEIGCNHMGSMETAKELM